MTKPKAATVRETTTTRTTRTVPAAPKPAAGDAAATLPAGIEQALEQLGADAAYVMLWRISDPDEPYVGRVPAADFSLDWVQAHHGGGKYRGRVADAGNVFRKTATFSIAGRPKTPDVAASSWTAAAPASAGGLPPWLTQLLVATVPAIGAAIVTRMLAEPKVDPLLLALLNKKSGDSVTAGELVTLLDNARKSARDDARELAEMANRARRDSASDGAGWPDVVRESLPPLIEAFNKQTDRERPVKVARVVGSIPTAGETSREGATVTTSATDEPRWIAKVRPYVPMIVGWADRGTTPEVKAANVLDDLDEQNAADLGEHTASETFVEDVFRSLPQLGSTPTRREWFTRFLRALQESFTSDDEPGEAKPVEGASNG